METSLYFFISYERLKKDNDNDNDIVFVVPENNNQKLECVFTDEIYDNQKYNYKKIFKVNK